MSSRFKGGSKFVSVATFRTEIPYLNNEHFIWKTEEVLPVPCTHYFEVRLGSRKIVLLRHLVQKRFLLN